jgi:hypothetical protein
MRIVSRIRPGLFIVIAAFVLAACNAFHGFQTNPKSVEGWLSLDTPSHAWIPVEPERQINLPAESVMAAAVLLTRRDRMQLDPENFARLVPGRDWPSRTGLTPFLVRGVALDEPRGAVRVLESDNEILVQYEGPRVRARAIAMPVIVLLAAPPTKVYVRISLFN